MGAWEITKKDLYLISRDRGALYTLLVLPIVFVAILGASTGKLITTQDETKLVKLGIVDEDGSELSQQVIRDLMAVGGLKAEAAENRDEARRQLQDGRYNLVLTIGPTFEERIEELELGDVLDTEHGKLSPGLAALDMQVECGSAFENVAQLVDYVVLAASLQSVTPEVAKKNRFAARQIQRTLEERRELYGSGEGKKPALPQSVEAGPSFIYQTLVPAYTVMFAFFLINIMANSFITERELGTLRRLQASPIRPVELLIGKTLPFLFVSLIQSLVLFVSGKLLFGMSWGVYPVLLLPVIVATSMAATSLGLLLATLVRTQSQVSAYANFLVITLAGISGCYMPRDWLPELMQNVSLATPHAWALIAYQQLLTRDRPDLHVVAQSCAMLAAFAGTYFSLGCLRFHKIG
jgi:ABC-2 type transport system permease protein